MRYLVFGWAKQPEGPPPQELMAAIMQLGEEATKAGALIDTAGLVPSASARVDLEQGELTVTDGPFTEAKELVSYAIYEVKTKEEAVEWASRFVKLHRDHWEGWEGRTEVVKVMGPEDFGPPPTE